MKLGSNQFSNTSARLLAVAAMVAVMALGSRAVFAADKDVHQDRAEMRINDMHGKLGITAVQEEKWGKVAQVMRDDAKSMDTLTQARFAHAKDMTAIDDLKSYGEITEAHANGIKNLTTEFAVLYADMSDAQKKTADTLFRNGDHAHHKHNHKHHHMMSKDK